MRNPKKLGSSSKKKKSKTNATEESVSADVNMTAGPSNGNIPAERPKVWRAGVDVVEDDEELQFDPSAYDCLHAFRLQWPCLSFDILRDTLGAKRMEFPHTLFCVAGTQADNAQDNTVAVMRLSNLTRIKQRRSQNEEEDDDSDSSSDDEAETNTPGRPSLEVRMVKHHGGVNRIRCMPQQPHVCATWGDTGRVQVWDMGAHVRTLAEPSTGTSSTSPAPERQAPLHIFSGHQDEGFALDWSPVTSGRLVTGDCRGKIHLWEPTEGGKWTVNKTPFSGHTSSVEDLQWSPTEAQVFASCSADQKLVVWDARVSDKPALSIKAHEADVNVISWNRLASCMLASGSDDGTFRIWDLRSFKEDAFVAHFKYHKQPITSVEWSFYDSSVLAVSSADNQLTVWDLSLERDTEEEAEFVAQQEAMQAEVPEDIPPQLVFVHQGQADMKELHWHAQIPGMLVSTARDGFNAFRPSNLGTLNM